MRNYSVSKVLGRLLDESLIVLRESWISRGDIKTTNWIRRNPDTVLPTIAGKCSTGTVSIRDWKVFKYLLPRHHLDFPLFIQLAVLAPRANYVRNSVLITRDRSSFRFDDWLNRGGNFYGERTFLRRFLLATKPTEANGNSLYYLYRWRNRETIWPRGSQNVRSNNCRCRSFPTVN